MVECGWLIYMGRSLFCNVNWALWFPWWKKVERHRTDCFGTWFSLPASVKSGILRHCEICHRNRRRSGKSDRKSDPVFWSTGSRWKKKYAVWQRKKTIRDQTPVSDTLHTALFGFIDFAGYMDALLTDDSRKGSWWQGRILLVAAANLWSMLLLESEVWPMKQCSTEKIAHLLTTSPSGSYCFANRRYLQNCITAARWNRGSSSQRRKQHRRI